MIRCNRICPLCIFRSPSTWCRTFRVPSTLLFMVLCRTISVEVCVTPSASAAAVTRSSCVTDNSALSSTWTRKVLQLTARHGTHPPVPELRPLRMRLRYRIWAWLINKTYRWLGVRFRYGDTTILHWAIRICAIRIDYLVRYFGNSNALAMEIPTLLHEAIVL